MGPSTIDQEELPRDVPGPISGQEGDGAGDVVGLSQSMERDAVQQRRAFSGRVLVACRKEIGLNTAGLNRVDSNMRRKLASQLPGESVNPRLARRVVDTAPAADERRRRGDIDDRGVIAAAQVRNRRATAVVGSKEIEPQGTLPDVQRHRVSMLDAGSAGIVDEHINPGWVSEIVCRPGYLVDVGDVHTAPG